MSRKVRVLAISSGGGHWLEMLRIRSAFDGADVVYATVNRDHREDVPGERFETIPDATRWNKVRLVWLAVRVVLILLKHRPDVVFSTGAAPGYIALHLGKILGARTAWLDSFANIEELSLSGQMAGKVADLWLTQWAELARPQGPAFRGQVF